MCRRPLARLADRIKTVERGTELIGQRRDPTAGFVLLDSHLAAEGFFASFRLLFVQELGAFGDGRGAEITIEVDKGRGQTVGQILRQFGSAGGRLDPQDLRSHCLDLDQLLQVGRP